MAKIKQGILGGFSGKVANVVGTSWKGRAVMKSQPLSVSNPRTENQVGQRNKFSKVAELASQILTQFVQPVENPISGDVSGYNLFCKDNKQAFDAAGVLVAANLCAGGGKIAGLPTISIIGDNLSDHFVATWTNDPATSAIRLTDKVYGFAIRESDGELFVASGASTRNDGQAAVTAINGGVQLANGDRLQIVILCVSADGRDVSVKTYAVEKTFTA